MAHLTVIHPVAESASAQAWLRDGHSLDRGRKVAAVGGIHAASSGRYSANGSPFSIEQLVGWIDEAMTPAAPRVIEMPQADVA